MIYCPSCGQPFTVRPEVAKIEKTPHYLTVSWRMDPIEHRCKGEQVQ